MKRFKLKPELDAAFIAGYGHVTKQSVIMGNQFEKHVPGLLVEVMPEPQAAPAPAPQLLTEVMPVAPVEGPSKVEKLEEKSEGDSPVAKKPGRPKGSTKTGG